MKPIIMSTEDVRGILDGRKTMARQVVKFKNGSNPFWSGYTPDGAVLYGGNNVPAAKSPYHAGDVLYVKETWKKDDVLAHLFGNGYIYAADADYVSKSAKWKSPVTMPRSAARLFLRVKDVRVEKNKDSGQWEWVYEFERTPSGAIGPEPDGTAPNGDKGVNK